MGEYLNNSKCFWSDSKRKCLNVIAIDDSRKYNSEIYISLNYIQKYFIFNTFWNYFTQCQSSNEAISSCSSNNSNSVFYGKTAIRMKVGEEEENINEENEIDNIHNTVLIQTENTTDDETDYDYFQISSNVDLEEYNTIKAFQNYNHQVCLWEISTVGIESNSIDFEFKLNKTLKTANLKAEFYYYNSEYTTKTVNLLSTISINLSGVSKIIIYYYSGYEIQTTSSNYFLDVDFRFIITDLKLSITGDNLNDTSVETNKKIDILMIIIPAISGFICFIACLGFLCTCCRKKKININTNEQANSDSRRLELFNHVQYFTRLQGEIQSIRNMNPENVVEIEDAASRNNKILEQLFRTELKGIKYITKLNKFKTDCTICLEGFTDFSIVLVLHCKHIFHRDCLKEWLEKNILKCKCPNCNYNVIHKTYDEVVEEEPVNNNLNIFSPNFHSINNDLVNNDMNSRGRFNALGSDLVNPYQYIWGFQTGNTNISQGLNQNRLSNANEIRQQNRQLVDNNNMNNI